MGYSRITCLILTLLLSFFSSRETFAMTVEVYSGSGGADAASGSDASGGDSKSAGIDVVFYDGTRSDIFFGVEKRTVHGNSESGMFSVANKLEYTTAVNAVTFGWRWKMRFGGRWSPYMHLGGIAGKADYNVNTQTHPNVVFLSPNSGSTNFGSYRFGIGMNVAVSERIGMGFELAATSAPPKFNLVVADSSAGEIRTVALGNAMGDALLKLRYSF